MTGRSTRRAARLARAVHQAHGRTGPGTPGLWTRLRALPRLVRAVRSGRYTGLTSTRLLLLLAGVGYVVSPVDLVPEGFLLALGLVDDLLVVGWVVGELMRETERFIAWEQGVAVPAGGPGGDTVPSYVVRD